MVMNALLRSIPLATMVGFALLVLTTDSVSAAPVNICDRTQEVQDAILGGLTGSPTCSTVTDTQLASITELDITGYSSASIVPGDFAGLAGLETLRIKMPSTLPRAKQFLFKGVVLVGEPPLSSRKKASL